MQLDEFKTLWLKLDKKSALYELSLKKITLGRAKQVLDLFGKDQFFTVVICLLLMVVLAIFIYAHISMLKFVLPAVLIALFALLQILFSVYQLRVILRMDYTGPVISTQRVLEQLKLNRLRYLAVTRFSYGLLWLPVLIVGFQAFASYDLYLYFHKAALISVMLIGLACLVFGVWLSWKISNKEMRSTFIKKLLANIYRNDIVGKNLYSSLEFLNDIERFENDAVG